MLMVFYFLYSYSLDYFFSFYVFLLGVILKYIMVKILSWNLIVILLIINCDKCLLIIKGLELYNELRIVYVRVVYNRYLEDL